MFRNFGSRATTRQPEDIFVDDEGFSEAERIDWLYCHTGWGPEFNPDRHAKTMLRIWEAEKIPNQQWNVTCTRRRKSGGFSRIYRFHVETLGSFPSRDNLENLAYSMGFGGGSYSVTSTRGVKFTHRFNLEGEPEDPFAEPEQSATETSREEVMDRFETRLLNIAIGYLEENTVYGREVALKYLEKKLGIKIRMPDRNAPMPYSELPVEYQDWLDENPDLKDAYIRKYMGIAEPEVEPTMEDRVVDGIKEKVIEDVVANFGSKPHGREKVLAEFLSRSNLKDVIEQLVPLLMKSGPNNDGGEPPMADSSWEGLLPIHLGFKVPLN